MYVWSVDDPHAAEPFLTVTVPNVDAITAAAFSPDGSRLLIVGGALRSSEPSEDGVVGFASQTIHIVSVGPAVAGGGRVVASLVVPTPSSSSAVASSPLAGRIMAAAWIVDARVEQNSSLVTVGNGTIQFWFLSPSPGGEDGSNAHSTMTLVPAKPLLGGFAGANKCSSSGAIIAGGCFPSVVSTADATYVGNSCDGSLLVFDGRRLVRKIAAHAGASVDAIAARPATAEIVTGGSDGFVRVWDERTLRVVATFDLNTSDKARSANGVRSIAVSARDDGGSHSFTFVVGTAVGAIYKFAAAPNSPSTGGFKQSTVVSGHCGISSAFAAVGGVAAHPSQPTAVTAGADGTLRLWDLTRRRQTHRADAVGTGALCAVAFSADGTRVAVGHSDGAVSLHNARNLFTLAHLASLGPVKGTVSSSACSALCVRFSPDGSRIAAGFADGSLRIFSVGGGDNDALALVGLLVAFKTGANSASGAVAHCDWSVDGATVRIDDDCRGTVSNCSTTVATIPPQIRFVSVGAEASSPRLTLSLAPAASCRDVAFATQTCTVGWGVHGVGEAAAAVAASPAASSSAIGPLLATAERGGSVALHPFPCPAAGAPLRRLCGHYGAAGTSGSCGPAGVCFSHNGELLLTAGGADACVMQWSLRAAN